MRAGVCPCFCESARNFALVPKCVTCSCATTSQQMSSSAFGIGAPSYSTIVTSLASALSSQFHIIHPQVVK